MEIEIETLLDRHNTRTLRLRQFYGGGRYDVQTRDNILSYLYFCIYYDIDERLGLVNLVALELVNKFYKRKSVEGTVSRNEIRANLILRFSPYFHNEILKATRPDILSRVNAREVEEESYSYPDIDNMMNLNTQESLLVDNLLNGANSSDCSYALGNRRNKNYVLRRMKRKEIWQ